MGDARLRSVNFGNSERHSLETEYAQWGASRVAIVGWGANQGCDSLTEVYELDIRTGMQLMTKAENVDRGKEIVRRHEARMMQGPRESRRRWEWATGAHR
jgi:hypothetical protein